MKCMKKTEPKAIECKAAVSWEPGKPLVVQNVEVQAPKEGEIRIKMAATGICYSDITMGGGSIPGIKFPVILGHEGVGVVESLGAGVKSFKTGDTVIPLWCFNCGKCRCCKLGTRNFCQEVVAIMAGNVPNLRRVSSEGTDISQVSGLGLFSEYIVVPEKAAVKVPSVPSLEKLASFGCCMPTGYGAAKYTAKVFPGATCAIWGLGAVGLCAALGCKDAGADKIIGINRSREKLEIGKKFGCTDCISTLDYPDKPISQVVKEMTDGLGVDFMFVCVGSIAVMEDGLEACAVGGSELVVLGVAGSGVKMSFDHLTLLYGKTIKGSFCGDCLCAKHIPELVQKYVKGAWPTDELITSTIALDQINEGIDLLKAGKAIRTVIKF